MSFSRGALVYIQCPDNNSRDSKWNSRSAPIGCLKLCKVPQVSAFVFYNLIKWRHRSLGAYVATPGLPDERCNSLEISPPALRGGLNGRPGLRLSFFLTRKSRAARYEVALTVKHEKYRKVRTIYSVYLCLIHNSFETKSVLRFSK